MRQEVNSAGTEIELFRKALSATLIGYYLSLIFKVQEFFGAQGWMLPSRAKSPFSLLLLSDANLWRWALLGGMFVLLSLLFFGRLNRWGLAAFYLISLSFYDWNYLILHEAQPLMNILTLSLFFLPLNKRENYDATIKNILIWFLGIYYFVSGIKKLPDPNFLNSTALEHILTWNVMAKNLGLNLFFVNHFRWGVRLMTYLTLIFEISFLFLVFTRWRVWLIMFGVFLHALIYITLDVGNLSFVMLSWYMLLLDSDTRAKFRSSLSVFDKKPAT